MRTGSPVIDIPDNVKMVDDQPLDQISQRNDKLRRPADADDRMDDLVVIGLFVLNLRLLRDQLLDNVCKILRKCFPHLGTPPRR